MIPTEGRKMGSLRQAIIKLLRKREMSARELSQMLSLPEKEVYDHMPHIKKSIKASGKELVIIQSRCLKCGFEFKDRKRLSPPSRCPICKEEHISDPVFRIFAKR
jgi:predicted Zn-ribbon and HTH transcriptional regulator